MGLAPAIKGVSAYTREAHASDAFGTTTTLVSDALLTDGHTIVSLEVTTQTVNDGGGQLRVHHPRLPLEGCCNGENLSILGDFPKSTEEERRISRRSSYSFAGTKRLSRLEYPTPEKQFGSATSPREAFGGDDAQADNGKESQRRAGDDQLRGLRQTYGVLYLRARLHLV